MSASRMVELYALLSAGPGASGSAALVQSLQAEADTTDAMLSAPVPSAVPAPAAGSPSNGGSGSQSSSSRGHTVDEYA